MPVDKENVKDARSALNFLIESNILSQEGIDDVPKDFVDKHLDLIHTFNLKTTSEISKFDLQEFHEGHNQSKSANKRKRWTHKSVLKLIQEADHNDPILEIKKRARKTVLFALNQGWSGPPFNAIELAKILNIDIFPNDAIPDARTVPLGGKKFRIEYNPLQKAPRLNFSIGHEITHTFFSDCYEEIRNREAEPEVNRQLEQLCNIGAAELQLPYVIFPADANRIDKITIEKIVLMAQQYNASLESFLLSFVEAVDSPCAVMIFTFVDETNLVLDYSKSSHGLDIAIPIYFTIPTESKAYYCSTPGSSQRETVEWPFMERKYDIFFIGISPMRKERKSRVAAILVPNTGTGDLQKKRIQIEFGDATKPKGIGIKIIAQVVNTSAALGIGFGKSLSMNYPIIKTALKKWKEDQTKFKLGNSQLVKVSDELYVFQMLAQKGLRSTNGETLLDYTCLKICLTELRETAVRLKGDVYMPLIGSGQARGKWEVIEGLVYSELVNQDVKVTIYLFGSVKKDEFRPNDTLSIFNDKSTWE